MKIRIHRGCHEIGGNCVEIESQGKRIVLDIGLPLKDDAAANLPDIKGLLSPDDSTLGIFISHPHPDHYGLLAKITQTVPVYMGDVARRIIDVSSFFTRLPALGGNQPLSYADRRPIRAGPFTITPFRIDHSAYDSHCLLVEADGKRLFYSGDIRGHGRNAHLFHEIINNPPPDIDVLICEGTQLGRNPDFAYQTEQAVADRVVEIFNETKGICLAWCSSQNIDRVASIWDAAKRSNRQLILDVYTAEILRAAQDDSLPKPGRDAVKVFLPFNHKVRIKREQAFHFSNPYKWHRIYPEMLAEAAARSVMIFRPGMLRELQGAKCLDGATLVSSLWSGYVHKSQREIEQMERLGIQRFHVHTSGHATVDELQQFLRAIPATRIVPIHLENREAFVELSERVELKNDHEWWEV